MLELYEHLNSSHLSLGASLNPRLFPMQHYSVNLEDKCHASPNAAAKNMLFFLHSITQNGRGVLRWSAQVVPPCHPSRARRRMRALLNASQYCPNAGVWREAAFDKTDTLVGGARVYRQSCCRSHGRVTAQ